MKTRPVLRSFRSLLICLTAIFIVSFMPFMTVFASIDDPAPFESVEPIESVALTGEFLRLPREDRPSLEASGDTGFRPAGLFEVREMLLIRPGESALEAVAVTAVRFRPDGVGAMAFLDRNFNRGSDGESGEAGFTAAGLRTVSEQAGFPQRLVFTAGFFDTSGSPLGLLVDRGRRLSRLRRKGRLAEGIFCLDGKRAWICSPHEFEGLDRTALSAITAVQAGPILVPLPSSGAKGDGPAWLASIRRESRCAVGMETGGRVVVVVVSGLTGGVTLAELASLMSGGDGICGFEGLGLVAALNLDGGTSAQLYLEAGEMKVARGGLRRLPALLVVAAGK